MTFRFQRRIKILPGLRLNVSKTGFSWTVGTRCASVTAKDGHLTGNAGIPGTGLSYCERLDLPSGKQDQVATKTKSESSGSGFPSILVMIIVLLIGIFIGLSLR
jgi:hypothetical protein